VTRHGWRVIVGSALKRFKQFLSGAFAAPEICSKRNIPRGLASVLVGLH
jgi:hypothetical protein